jgi:hypothetical protein
MAILTLFRSDLRVFNEGDPMLPPGDHLNELSEDMQKADLILRRVAGVRERVRADLIFTFESLVYAKKYFIGKPDRYLYELAVDEKDAVHMADMMLVNQIAKVHTNLPVAEDLAAKYWSGDLGNGERVEVVVAAARVEKVLYTPSERKALREELYPRSKPDYGDKEFYENLFNRTAPGPTKE